MVLCLLPFYVALVWRLASSLAVQLERQSVVQVDEKTTGGEPEHSLTLKMDVACRSPFLMGRLLILGIIQASLGFGLATLILMTTEHWQGSLFHSLAASALSVLAFLLVRRPTMFVCEHSAHTMRTEIDEGHPRSVGRPDRRRVRIG